MAMIDEKKLTRIESGQTGPGKSKGADLDLLNEIELRMLRGEIERRLPPNTLSSLNLEDELVNQYNLVKLLQSQVLNDDSIPLNQRSQLAGQVASTLQQLVKMQSEFHTAERFKKLEGFMVKAIRAMPVEAASKFLDDYEELGKTM